MRPHFRCTCLCVAFALAALAPVAGATAISTHDAILYWDQLTITGVADGDWTQRYSGAVVQDIWVDGTGFPWQIVDTSGTALDDWSVVAQIADSETVNGGAIDGAGESTTAVLSSHAVASADGSSGPYPWNTVTVYAIKNAYFVASTTGPFALSLPYAISEQLFVGLPGDTAFGISIAGVSVAEYILYPSAPAEFVQLFWVQDLIAGAPAGAESRTGVLNLSFDLVPGHGYAFSAGTTAASSADSETSSAVVPEPATLAIFSLGLAGLAISRRRKP